jgi:1-deoxy-D-xylulose-5-phosphate reductoisomerase
MLNAEFAVVGDEDLVPELERQLRKRNSHATVLAGVGALVQVARMDTIDTVMAAIVGAAGLPSTLAAAQAGKTVLLANKEAMVIAGPLFRTAVRECGATILPVDSEHNALFQVLPEDYHRGLHETGVEKLILTASGGPFLDMPADQLDDVTPEQACNHPNWDMGRKISVDSATLMNKGLEVIEARWLFNAKPGQIEVVVHPQSIIHSLVAFRDGSVLAQMGNPDMRTPIAHALAWPKRMDAGVMHLDLASMSNLEFRKPDTDRFPCLALAFEALKSGEHAPVVLNAANEIAVEAFLDGRLAFTRIAGIIAAVMKQVPARSVANLEEIMECDRIARTLARQMLNSGGNTHV